MDEMTMMVPTWRQSYQEGAPGLRAPGCQILPKGQGGGPAGQARRTSPSFTFFLVSSFFLRPLTARACFTLNSDNHLKESYNSSVSMIANPW